MIPERGGIYLANLIPSRGTEPGKTRPCVVIQNELLNESGHPSTVILPVTSNLLDDAAPLRFSLTARDKLGKNSQVLVDQPRTIDNRRLSRGLLATLTGIELAQLEEFLKIVLGFE